MRTQYYFLGLLLAAFVVSISSCLQEERSIGGWNDSIKLSTRKADFSAAKDSVIITTKGTWWWVNDISVNGNYLIFNPIETEKENFAIHGDWFSIERCDNQKLIVRVSENRSSEDRNIKITLEAGDYFDYIDVNQLGKH
ncbi:hypothetical protein CLV62_101403 [Dysgonomonas alginatilytica]|uniref:BACON domain-containing protein n=1 Tax=Dysgonomonas alginatilytica TaxID=1605892 RepID=A0A2V3PWG3_9BACT|nr:BACON domain-containing protein [Dysgonomonas alginatilytica]PXV69134.1 hypothetical protein CLV62_101403 [Dysgonomonas alginatilytica]